MDDSESLNQPGCGVRRAASQFYATRLRTVDPLLPEADVIAWAASCIICGGVVIYPTETFYGLGGDPRQLAVVERIFRIKERDVRTPLPLIAADMDAVRQAVAQWPAVADLLAQVFWPGPLTLVLAASTRLPPTLHAQTGKIAVRVSSHAVAQKLAAAAGGLLISTSANRAGLAPCQIPDKLPKELIMKVDGVLQGGPTVGGLPSTLVDVTVQPPKLVREGAIGWDRIKAVLS
jgi:L-threonylcarbamoyladenylate synthase